LSPVFGDAVLIYVRRHGLHCAAWKPNEIAGQFSSIGMRGKCLCSSPIVRQSSCATLERRSARAFRTFRNGTFERGRAWKRSFRWSEATLERPQSSARLSPIERQRSPSSPGEAWGGRPVLYFAPEAANLRAHLE
jgi:hypothetical protein